MPETPFNSSAVARRVALAVSRLESLSTLPSVKARVFSKFRRSQFSPSMLTDIVESDPALMAGMLSAVGRSGTILSSENFAMRQAVEKLPADAVRDVALSVAVFGDFESIGGVSRKDLWLHSLAAACCAESIARIASVRVNPHLAYCAGLLHDLGKLALQDAMPKSFARIVEQAASAGASTSLIEHRNLDADHTIFGKHLAQKWRLPGEISLAIWLHHSDTAAIAASMPHAEIAQVVQLADSVALQSGIGKSGSCGMTSPIEENARSLGIELSQLEEISRNLLGQIAEKSNLLGLDSTDAMADYAAAAAAAAIQFADSRSSLIAENRRLQASSTHLDFVTDFLLSIDSSAPVIDIAESFAAKWQKFYQTGSVCLYLAPSTETDVVDAVIVESLGQSRAVCLEVPDGVSAVPRRIAGGFAILDAGEHIGRLLEQLDVDFNPGATRLLPLLSNGVAVGAIAFELHYPGDAAMFEEKFKASSSIAGAVLGLALAGACRQGLAERFVSLISSRSPAQPASAEQSGSTTAWAEAIEALAELAAGAAHELNNPLAIVSGRAQLLAAAETDLEKKEILNQIQSSAGRASAIIEDLLRYAEPLDPRPTRTNVRKMIDEALQLTSRKTNVEHLNVHVDAAEDAMEVFADSAQIASALANILTNSVESYDAELGPIKVTARADRSGRMVRLQVADLGCGMDARAAGKATAPFYSSKAAGRKRGMGLAYAARFAQINGGALEIESRPAVGTTVTISVPAG
ncbi:MAG: HDOD domain-containing protein [Sedimentisphaerales bacterium]|nr:HDOD domain-containing protein [Sedimentisphaerales bacterium]